MQLLSEMSEQDKQKFNDRLRLSMEEEKRSELLMRQLHFHQTREEQIKKELRKIVYKLDRKI